ncbi:MAG: hypothetical protein JXB36_09490 [Gammaproteobacteria bacterium]|nr:hypothetical protein [Gammaproteobacteria bacterium]
MSATAGSNDGFKLVEDSAGVGQVAWRDEVFPEVRYEVRRYQGMTSSGLPVPGLHRIEGSVDLGSVSRRAEILHEDFVLHLEDGRAMRVTLADEDGRVLAEGHGPSRCTCC